MALPAIPPIELTPEQIGDVTEAVEMLERLADDLEKAKACSTPGLEECETQRRELLQRLRAYREHFAPASPSVATRPRKRK